MFGKKVKRREKATLKMAKDYKSLTAGLIYFICFSVLPTFDVKAVLDQNYILADDEAVRGTLYANYRYGSSDVDN